jgi:hypothetical protein
MGQVSRITLSDIKVSMEALGHKIYSRPVYVDPLSTYNELPEYLSNQEIFPSENIEWSCIIQHLPIDFLTAQSFTKSAAIPFVNNQLIKTSKYNSKFKTLNYFNNILVTSDAQKNLLLKSDISSKIIVYNESMTASSSYLDNEIKNKQFDLGLSDDSYVFCFIGSYSSNQQILRKLIISFLIAFRGESNKKLFLLLKGTNKDKEEIDRFYNEMRKKLKLFGVSPILFSFCSLSLPEAIAAINSSSCYLSINDDISHNIYEKYAKSTNKQTITKHSLEINQLPISDVGDMYDIEDIIGSINSMSLSQKLKSIITESAITNKNRTNNKSIGETICSILR